MKNKDYPSKRKILKLKSMKTIPIIFFLAFMISLSVPAQMTNAQGKPGVVKITKHSLVKGKNSISLTWKKAKNAKKYQVAIKTSKNGWKIYKTVNKTPKNKKKYNNKNKYKIKAKGNKYLVYVKGKTFQYNIVKSIKANKYIYKGKAGKTYIIVVRGLNGKYKGKWSKAVKNSIPAARSTTTGSKKPVSGNQTGSTNSGSNKPVSGNQPGSTTTGGNQTVQSPSEPEDETAGSNLNKTSFSLTKGESTTISLNKYSGKTDVKWTSSKPGVIAIESTSGRAKTTVKIKAKAASGTSVITASVGKKSFKASVTARPETVLSSSSISLMKGYTTNVTLNNYYGTTDVTWKSANTKIASVTKTSGTHKVTATIKATAARGSTTISVKAGNKTYKLTVKDKAVPSIKQGDMTLPVGSKQQLTVQNYSGTPKWSSSNTSVATVSSKGLVTVKGTSKTTVITANCGGVKATCKITARKKTPEEETVYVKNTYYDTDKKEMIKADVPKGWKFTVTGINHSSGICEPVVEIKDPTGKYCVYHRISMGAVKNKDAQNFAKQYPPYVTFLYPIPVKGYNSKGYDAAGLFRGYVSYSGLKSFAVEKKLMKSVFGSDILVTRATDKKNVKYRFIFCGQIHDLGTQMVTIGGKTFDAGFLLCQDIVYLKAPYNDLDDWAPVLGHIYGSIEYTETCVKRYVSSGNETTAQIRKYSETFNDQQEKMVNNFLNYINK